MYDLNVTFNLPQIRLCAAVVLAWGHADQPRIANANAELQVRIGNGWSTTSAFQFMSGKAAKAA
jgi:hypothetical protein